MYPSLRVGLQIAQALIMATVTWKLKHVCASERGKVPIVTYPGVESMVEWSLMDHVFVIKTGFHHFIDPFATLWDLSARAR